MNQLSLEQIVLILNSVEKFKSIKHSFDFNNLCIVIVTDLGTYRVLGCDFSTTDEFLDFIYKAAKDTIVKSLSFHIY